MTSLDRDKLIELITNGNVQAISWDVQIVEDKLKHASWMLALATAGLGSIVIRGATLIGDSWVESEIVAKALVIVVIALFLSSLVVGALFQFRAYKSCDHKRQMMTLYLKQDIYLRNESSSTPSLERMHKVGELPEPDRTKFAELKNGDPDEDSLSQQLIWQQVLSAVAYAALLLVAFPR